jgi:hypothetical protein
MSSGIAPVVHAPRVGERVSLAIDLHLVSPEHLHLHRIGSPRRRRGFLHQKMNQPERALANGSGCLALLVQTSVQLLAGPEVGDDLGRDFDCGADAGVFAEACAEVL